MEQNKNYNSSFEEEIKKLKNELVKSTSVAEVQNGSHNNIYYDFFFFFNFFYLFVNKLKIID